MGLNLITKAEYKAYVGISSTNNDAEIDSLIPKVSAFIKNYCRRSFIDYLNDAKTEVFNGGSKFYLKEFPVDKVLSLEYSNDYGQNYQELVEFTDWVLDTTEAAILPINATGVFAEYINGYIVTYTGGYETVPEDLKLAVMDLITYYRKSDSSIHNTKTPTSNSMQVEYITNTSLPAHIKRVLDLYVADYS